MRVLPTSSLIPAMDVCKFASCVQGMQRTVISILTWWHAARVLVQPGHPLSPYHAIQNNLTNVETTAFYVW